MLMASNMRDKNHLKYALNIAGYGQSWNGHIFAQTKIKNYMMAKP